MRRTARLFLCASLPLLLVAGCQPLNYETTYTIPAVGSQSTAFAAPRYAQKIKVTVTAQDGPVDTYVVKDPDGKYGENAPLGKPPAESVIASKTSTKAEEYTLEATVPAKTAYAILLYAHKKKTEVKLKVTGR